MALPSSLAEFEETVARPIGLLTSASSSSSAATTSQLRSIGDAIDAMERIRAASQAQGLRCLMVAAIVASVIAALCVHANGHGKSHRALLLLIIAGVLIVDATWFLCALGVWARPFHPERVRCWRVAFTPQLRIATCLARSMTSAALSLAVAEGIPGHSVLAPDALSRFSATAFRVVAPPVGIEQMVASHRTALALLLIHARVGELKELRAQGRPAIHEAALDGRLAKALSTLREANSVVAPDMTSRHRIASVMGVCGLGLGVAVASSSASARAPGMGGMTGGGVAYDMLRLPPEPDTPRQCTITTLATCSFEVSVLL